MLVFRYVCTFVYVCYINYIYGLGVYIYGLSFHFNMNENVENATLTINTVLLELIMDTTWQLHKQKIHPMYSVIDHFML